MKKTVSFRLDVLFYVLVALFFVGVWANAYSVTDRVSFGWCNAKANSIKALYECPAPYLKDNAAK